MDIAGIQSGMVGMALFDLWMNQVHKTRGTHKPQGSPLVAAAAAAFEQYIGTVETQIGAQILGLSTYALSPKGDAAKLLTPADTAPIYALNLMA
jgi:hypothetical protein